MDAVQNRRSFIDQGRAKAATASTPRTDRGARKQCELSCMTPVIVSGTHSMPSEESSRDQEDALALEGNLAVTDGGGWWAVFS